SSEIYVYIAGQTVSNKGFALIIKLPEASQVILFLHKKYRFVFRFIIITANLRNIYITYLFL
ncbi:hypothetical protein, partial [Neisseria subflava]|uniref:hypothetical protein n=1 Tax=Neisseria subflava TaxID=28449 RepID=UPI0024B22623